MVAALSSGHLGAGSQERLKAATWHRGNSAHSSLRWTVLCSAAVQKGLKETEATQKFTLTLFQKVFGLLQMSPDAPCQIRKEAQRPRIKYPLHKEVEPGTSLLQRHGAPLCPPRG